MPQDTKQQTRQDSKQEQKQDEAISKLADAAKLDSKPDTVPPTDKTILGAKDAHEKSQQAQALGKEMRMLPYDGKDGRHEYSKVRMFSVSRFAKLGVALDSCNGSTTVLIGSVQLDSDEEDQVVIKWAFNRGPNNLLVTPEILAYAQELFASLRK